MTRPRPLGNRAAELVDKAITLLSTSRQRLRDAELRQDRHPDTAAAMRDKADHGITEAVELLLRVRHWQYEE